MAILVKAGKAEDPVEVEAIYHSAVMTGIVGKEVWKDGVLVDGCFVQDPVALFNLCGVRVGSVAKLGADYKAKPEEIEIQLWHRDADTPKGMKNAAHDHFVLADAGKVVYDGLGQSNTVRYGFLKSKRIFK